MSSPPSPLRIPPPNTVRVAAILVVIEALGLLVIAVATAVSGVSNGARTGQLVAEIAYFVILGAAVALVAAGLLRGRRWSRTPAAVAQVVTIAVGMWVAFPSAQLRWGLIVIAVGAAALALLVTPAANAWIKQFPRPFGLGQDR